MAKKASATVLPNLQRLNKTSHLKSKTDTSALREILIACLTLGLVVGANRIWGL
jgi:hypothetical protein